jgi:CRISPR-associated protein Cas1
MIKRTIEISSGPTRLSVTHRQLVIEKSDGTQTSIPIEDLGVVIVDHPAVSYTHAVFTDLLAAGAAVVLCSRDHHPAGIFLPIDAHSTQTERHHCQIEATGPFKKQTWARVVRAKIERQADVIQEVVGRDEGLRSLSTRVRSGDPDNLEAQAAQRYWKVLFGKEFRRGRDGNGPNKALNYGYAIIRAAIARAIAGSGLIPSLGLHHHNRSNPFCLADDLMEPYRPFIDLKVSELVRSGHTLEELDRTAKTVLLSVLNETIQIGDRRTPVGLAIHQTTASMARGYETGKPQQLDLPSSLFLRQCDLDLGSALGPADDRPG